MSWEGEAAADPSINNVKAQKGSSRDSTKRTTDLTAYLTHRLYLLY
jgi:hypothetical protein